MWFYPDSHSVFFPKATRCVILSLLHFNKFFKTLLTHSTCRGIFLVNPIDFVDWFKFIHKMWSCSFWTQLQKVVGYHHETHHFSEGKSTKEFTAPQHTRFILPPIHPTKSIAALRGRYFLQIEPYVVVRFSEIHFRLLTAQLQSVILVLERSRTQCPHCARLSSYRTLNLE